MKKILFFVVIGFFTAAVGFAQSYNVQSVTGQVQRESGSRRINIRNGEVLNANVVIHTALGASIVLRQGDVTVTIPAARSGRVGDLVAQVAQELEADGTAPRTINAPMNRTAGNIPTAAARSNIGMAAAQDEDSETDEE